MSTSSTSESLSIPQPAPYLPPSKIRHEWFQTDSFITLTVFVKKIPSENVSLNLTPRTLSLTINLPSGNDYSLELDPLAHDIVPDESKWSVLSTKVEIKLKKQVVGIRWGTLEGEESGPTGSIAGASAEKDKPAYPSSAKKKHDWDALARETDTEKPEGEQALNALFQQIYRDADENTRRAMMKSYVESNGTCLSTNWSEVGSKKVEVTPPEGMEAKKFEL
ncbi:SGS domain-containing protein [Gaertneriomyces semiglobifer]|nr:SGS domain-containing protein [Gaertneriomyces semiglobifer]